MNKHVLFFILSILLSCKGERSTSFKRSIHEYDNYDNSDISRSEYLDVLSGPKNRPSKNKKSHHVHKTKLMATPKKPSDIPDKLISISVTEDVPLKEVLLEIGHMANLDIQISPKIDSYIIFTAKNKPLVDVLTSITEIANVRYKVKNGIVIFEPDEAYVETYNIHFLNITRNTNSSKSVSTSVGGSSGSSSGSGGGSGGGSNSQSSSSSFSLQTKSEDKMWDDLEIGLNQIISEESLNERKLEESKKKKELATLMEASQQQSKADLANPTPGLITSSVDGLGNAINNALIPAAPTPPSLALQALQNQQANQGQQANQQNVQNAMGKNAISINKQGGLIAIYANKKAQVKIASYLNLLHKKIMSQVLIEVKILEVTLDSQYVNGIDWGTISNTIGSTGLTFASGFATYGASAVASTIAASAATLKISGSNAANTIISALNTFGTVKTIISPRLNATNNQQAVLSRAQNDVYFNMSITNNFVNGSGGLSGNTNTNNLTNSLAQQFSISATPQTIANGVNLTVQPSIDFEKREITMNVRPMISGITSTVQDPGFAFIVAQSSATSGTSTAVNGLQNNIPVTISKEFDTIVKVKDGEMMIMGGFTQNVKSIKESGLPFLSEIPWIGMLFKRKTSIESVVETVLLIKATIIDDGEDNLHDADKALYNKMANYPRKEYF